MTGIGLQGIKRVIAVAAGKGGVGKSTMTVGLADVLQTLGLSVGVLDADLYGPSVAKMLPYDQPVGQDGDYLIPAYARGIRYISMGLFGDEGAANAVRAPIANAMIARFLHKVYWKDLDLLLIDLPPGTGDICLTVMQSVKLFGAVVVTTPQQVSVIDVKKCMEMLERMKVPCLGVVENMSYYLDPLTTQKHRIFSEGGGKNLAKEFEVPFLGEVPLDPLLCEHLDRGESIFTSPAVKGSKESLWQIGVVLREKICEDTSLDKTFVGIERVGESQVEIEFYGGDKRLLTLAKIQASCPCARCIDRVSGRRMMDVERLDPNVRAFSIERLGNYGFRFEFSSGCKQGFYAWDHLKRL